MAACWAPNWRFAEVGTEKGNLKKIKPEKESRSKKGLCFAVSLVDLASGIAVALLPPGLACGGLKVCSLAPCLYIDICLYVLMSIEADKLLW